MDSWETELEIDVWRSEDLKPGYQVFGIYSIHSIINVMLNIIQL